MGLDEACAAYANAWHVRDSPIELTIDAAAAEQMSVSHEVALSGDEARIRFEDCALTLTRGIPGRRPATLRAHLADITADGLVHPYLSLPAAIFSDWLDRGTFHAAAFLVGDLALAVIAGPGGGKSSTAAAAHRRGLPVMCDDLLVLDGLDAAAGPRCLDLRPDAAAIFGHTRTVDAGHRLRYRRLLDDVPGRAPLGGVVELTWADHIAVEPMSPSERARLWIEACALGAGTMPSALLLRLLTVPAWRVSRPRDLTSLDDVFDELCRLPLTMRA